MMRCAAVVLALALGCSEPEEVGEDTLERCSDDVDNDLDGLVDCADPRCQEFPRCASEPDGGGDADGDGDADSDADADTDADSDGDSDAGCREPEVAGSLDIPGKSWDIDIKSELAVVAAERALQFIDVLEPTAPSAVGSLALESEVVAVTIVDSVAFAVGSRGLAIVDASDPAVPVLRSVFDADGDGKKPIWDPTNVAVWFGQAFVTTCEPGGLTVVDVSDLDSPSMVGGVGTDECLGSPAILEERAILPAGWDGLLVADITTPSMPVVTATLELAGYAREVAFAFEPFALVTQETSGLAVVDLTDLDDPVLFGSVDTPGTCRGVGLAGRYAVLADGTSGLQVVDIGGDPAAPVIVASLPLPGEALRVVVEDGFAFVACLGGDLQVVDLGCFAR